MDLQSIILALFFALTIFVWLIKPSRTSKNLPPGPTPLPLIGNLHLLGAQPHKSLAKLAQEHGPIMSLKLGQVTTVVISSSAMAKEVLQKQDLAFSNRSIPNALHAHDHYKYSVVWLPVASRWRSLRKILKTNIFSGNRLDANPQVRFKKVEEMIEYCRRKSETGEAVDIGQAAFRTILNLLSNTIFSKDLIDAYSDSAKEFKDLVWNILMEAGKPNLVDYFFFLEKFDPQGIRRNMTIHFGNILKIFDGLINERLEQNKSHGLVKNDVLDVLLMKSEENPEEIDRTHILRMCLDLYTAGTDTTSSLLEWAMTELLKNPIIMVKAKEELAKVVGGGKSIKETDIASLPYLRCIVKETLRIHPSVPLIPRRVEQDVEVCGYIIPKGSQVLVNSWIIGRDSSVWENPLTFKPERFWESENNARGQDFEMIPFGTGRRICPGLPLAMRSISLMIGSLLNSFDWKIEGDIAPDLLDVEEKFGLALRKARPLRAIPISL